MAAYLMTHPRVPTGVPNAGWLRHLQRVESTLVFLMELPDMDRPKRWYDSSQYQKMLHQRTDNVISDLILVDRVGTDFTAAEWAEHIRAAIGARCDAAMKCR